MSDLAIRVEGLSKHYRIHALRTHHNTLRDELIHGLKGWFGRKDQRDGHYETIWALDDLSFELKHGEVLGVIGRNGAGKSTLLKILSRITEPSRGYAEIHGRVGSLLEVGTGFHGELTGRENIYLNGAVLGMSRAEIKRKFDEIVDFSGVGDFIDTPVKRYSSGMTMRLAFSVAAHLEPEILIIDEVLAVGDVSFQKKCLGKMGEVAKEGRTILFVSHNMGAVANLCTGAILLEAGKLTEKGDTQSVIRSYLKSSESANSADPKSWRRRGTGEARITNAELFDTEDNPTSTFSMGDTIVVAFDVEFYRPFLYVDLVLEVKRIDMGISVLHMLNQDCGLFLTDVAPGKRRFRVELPNCMLYPNSYQFTFCIWTPGTPIDFVDGILDFSMVQSDITQRTWSLSGHKEAIFYIPTQWREIDIEEQGSEVSDREDRVSTVREDRR